MEKYFLSFLPCILAQGFFFFLVNSRSKVWETWFFKQENGNVSLCISLHALQSEGNQK